MRMRHMHRYVTGCVVIALMFCGGLADAATLEEELYEVDKLRAGFATPFEQVESRCAELLQRYKEPAEQAKIYFQLAQVEGQSGLQHPQRLVGYIEKALALPLEPTKRVRLYIYWGDVIQVSHRGVRGRELIAARSEAVMPYLYGMKELLKYDLPEAKPEVPGIRVVNYDGPKDTQEYQELVREQQRQIEARDRAVFQRGMIEYHDVLTNQISLMYSRLPFATDELQELATQILEDKVAVDRLMSHVRQRVQKRLDDMGLSELNELPEGLALPNVDTVVPNVPGSVQKDKDNVHPVSIDDDNARTTSPLVSERGEHQIPSSRYGLWVFMATAAGVILLVIAVAVVIRRSGKSGAS